MPLTDVHTAVVTLTTAERQPCEIWTRVMGYHRPVESFNDGKKAEHAERVPFIEPANLKGSNS